MKLSLVGTGRVAFHLAQAFLAQGHELVQVCGRDEQKTRLFAQQIGASACKMIAQLQPVDLIVMAVSDSSIAEVARQLPSSCADSLVVHTSGSTSLKVISEQHGRTGVFYPLQTFSLERSINWKNTPVFIEAATETDLKLLTELARGISDRIYSYSSQQRLSLHLAAVFACNFSNYCYDMAKQIVDAEQVDFSLLYPLILETAQKATQNEPRKMQTGPAMRGDRNILDMHLELLQQSPDFQRVYQQLSDAILKRHQLPDGQKQS